MIIENRTIPIILLLSLINFLYPAQISDQEDKKYEEIEMIEEIEKISSIPNTLPELKEKTPTKTFKLTMTAYSSTPDQTSGDPFITASGERVRDGIIAYNYLPTGTYVRFPEAFGDKVFVVKDRLPNGASNYLADMWVHSRQEAKNWGARVVTMEVF